MTHKLTLIEHGDVYAPAPQGVRSVLLAGGTIATMGTVDRRGLDLLGVEYDIIDASDCFVTPGLIDPHEHLLGGSGEGGFAMQTPMLFLPEIVRYGVTTVVGVLGVDTTMKTMAGLLARVKALGDGGMTACMWSGGYNVPPTTVLGSIREDMLFIDECIGAGEIAVSDERGLNQSAQELAKLVRDTYVGGHLSNKSGVTHFHVGEEETRLAPLRELIDDFQCKPESLYPTHVQRNEKLLKEAIALAKRGATLDFDTTEGDLARWFAFYRDHDGPMDRLTISSDADSSTPAVFWQQLCGLVVKHGVPLETMLRLATSNTARVLKLPTKGCLEVGKDADVVVMDRGTLEIREVIAKGTRLVVEGLPIVREGFVEKSSRHVTIAGDKQPGGGVERLLA